MGARWRYLTFSHVWICRIITKGPLMQLGILQHRLPSAGCACSVIFLSFLDKGIFYFIKEMEVISLSNTDQVVQYKI
jgi:hypothetical protein